MNKEDKKLFIKSINQYIKKKILIKKVSYYFQKNWDKVIL